MDELDIENHKVNIRMKCQVCGSKMTQVITNIPFKVDQSTIIILKDLPVRQCDGCTEFLLDDPVMKRVDEILGKVDTSAELEVIRYAA
jgi:YgiT-type zinc finger domain-containing protein